VKRNNKTPEESEAIAREMLVKVGLADRVQHQPQELSGGQQQRVAIARALVNKPVLLIADEPTGNLDSHAGEDIMNLLHDVHSQGATIVMFTHDPKIAAHTERTIEVRDGRLNKSPTTEESFAMVQAGVDNMTASSQPTGFARKLV